MVKICQSNRVEDQDSNIENILDFISTNHFPDKHVNGKRIRQ